MGLPRKGDKKIVKPLWFLTVTGAFTANGFGSVILSHYERLSSSAYRSEFMIMAMAIVVVFNAVGMIITLRKGEKPLWVASTVYGGADGIFMGAMNVLFMVLVQRMNVSVVYPIVSSIALVVSSLAGILCFKEKPDKLALIGIATGLVAVLLLNV